MDNILAFDFGGTHIKYGIVTYEGMILDKGYVPTPKSLEGLLDVIQNQLDIYADQAINGIAISSPGAVADNGIIHGSSAIPYLHGPNMKARIESVTGLTAHIENDANCVGLAEVWKGSAKDKNDVAVVVVGTGIGGALVKDGKIHKGSHLHGGEFGYIILNPNELGNGMNSFSEVASTYSIIKRVALAKGIDASTLTGEGIFAQAEQGDPVCIQAISEFYRMLAIGLYNIQYIYDPELILIGGAISARTDLIPRLKEEINQLITAIDVATIIPAMDTCYFHADANLIGAVYHYVQQNLL